MAWGKCYDCGKRGYVQEHHVFGREIDPDTVVNLCPSCHHLVHGGCIIFLRDNAASRKFTEWREGQWAQGLYVKLSEYEQKLKEFGYVPMPDGWKDSEDHWRV